MFTSEDNFCRVLFSTTAAFSAITDAFSVLCKDVQQLAESFQVTADITQQKWESHEL